MMSDDPVRRERRGHTLVVTIQRPEALNAINVHVHRGIGESLEAAQADPDIRAVVLTGSGERAFSAGADLKAIARGEAILPDNERERAWGFAGFVRHAIDKPTIVAVNGIAVGGGTEITLAADLAVAAESASFGLPEVTRGIIAGAGGAFRLGAQLPAKVAMELLLTGRRISAREALTLGLVNRVVPDGTVVEAALALAEEIGMNAPLAVQASKRVARGIRDGAVDSEEAAWELMFAESARIRETADAKEGPRAFSEKRAAQWTGR